MKADVKKNIFQFIVFPAVLIAAVILAINVMGYVQNSNGADTERIRQTAASLEARGLYQAALDELDRYRETTILSREDEADLLFKMGKIADENLDDCERALKYFTMADALNPEASWSKESGKRSVICLEKIGKTKDSTALLKQLTGDDHPAPGAGDSPVIAVLDGRSVTWAEVEAAIENRRKGAEPMDLTARQKAAHDYVVTTMIHEEALRQGLDQDEAAKVWMERSRREALVAYYLYSELGAERDEDAMKTLIESLAKIHQVRIFNEAVPAP